MSDPVVDQNSEGSADDSANRADKAVINPAADALPPAAASTSLGTAATAGTATPLAGSGSGAAKFLEWFWLGRAMRAVHERGSTLTPRGQELLRRARLATEVGNRTLEPPDPLPSGAADAIACELYRESVEWSLLAYQEQGKVVAARGGATVNRDPAELWASAETDLIAKVADDAAAATRLRGDVIGRSYRDFAELSPSDQSSLARRLRVFAEGLTSSLDVAQSELDKLWLKRLLRLGLAALVIGGLVLLLSRGLRMSESGDDLAVGATWSASSIYGAEPGCTSPAQECAGSPNFFVHTNEESNPWVQFDLKAPKSISGVRVENRVDCCYERAVPLVVEVSDDGKKWTEVARRDSDFNSWKASFDKVETRYVRLRVDKEKTNLHFSRVRILP